MKKIREAYYTQWWHFQVQVGDHDDEEADDDEDDLPAGRQARNALGPAQVNKCLGEYCIYFNLILPLRVLQYYIVSPT